MLNLKLLSFLVIVIAIALVWSAANDGGAGSAKDAAASANFSAVADLKGRQFCPEKDEAGVTKTDCGEGSFAHHYNCCGDQQKECCFALQIWVYIVLAVIVLAMIISTIVGIVCCCCKK
ncbi:unnamed protein product [Caenorhabditis brenneri]